MNKIDNNLLDVILPNNINNADIDLGYVEDENGKKVKLTQSNYIIFMNFHLSSENS